MLGAFAGLTAEIFTGKSIVEQYRMGARLQISRAVQVSILQKSKSKKILDAASSFHLQNIAFKWS